MRRRGENAAAFRALDGQAWTDNPAHYRRIPTCAVTAICEQAIIELSRAQREAELDRRYLLLVEDAGWCIGTFGETRKWWNPGSDDGSRYCADNPRAVRYIVEDHPEQFSE
jgi:hypothetical protein